MARICLAILLFPALFTVADASRLPQDILSDSQRHIHDIPEFRFAARLAGRRKLRLWIAGGTAAGWLAACRQRLAGETKQLSFGELYRSTQDVDLLIDGTVEDAEALEKLLCRRFPYRRGNQCIWEVRPLRFARGEKPAALGDPESTMQHTDTLSLGAIELSPTPKGEPHVRDIRAWDSHLSPFLVDTAQRRIRFLRSPNHRETNRFLRGDNPEIFAVIRYCSKRFQLGLNPSPEDEALLREIVDAFDPYADVATQYAKTWMEHNGLKLLRNADDLEAAVAFLDRIGLRKKLFLAAGGFAAATRTDGLAYALTREPLPSFAVGTGDGATAESLGLSQVHHDTRDFETFEAITSSSLDSPNVFNSLPVPGETVIFGSGFYVRTGDAGRQTGYRIRLELLPNAHEGADFARVGPDLLLVRNRAALRLVRPRFATDPDRWIALLEELPTSARDRGWRERFERTLRGWLASRRHWTEEAVDKLESLLARQLALPQPSATLLGYGARELPSDKLAKLAVQWAHHPSAARLLAEVSGDDRAIDRLRKALADNRPALQRLSEIGRLLDARRRRVAASHLRTVVRIVTRARSAMRSVDDLLLVLGERGPRGELFNAIAPIAEDLCHTNADASTLLGMVERGESPEVWRRLLRQTKTMSAFLQRLRWGRHSGGRLTPPFSRVLVSVASHLESLSPTLAELNTLRAQSPDARAWTVILSAVGDSVRDVVQFASLTDLDLPEAQSLAARHGRISATFLKISASRLRSWHRQVLAGAAVDAGFAKLLRWAVERLPAESTIGCRQLLLDGLKAALNGGVRPPPWLKP